MECSKEINPIRLVVVGLGLVGRQHVERINLHPHAKLVSVVQPNDLDDLAIRAIGDSSVPVFGDLSECIEAKKPDAVILASPTNFHYEQIKVCMTHGVATLVEKPITQTANEAYEMHCLSEKTKVPLLVGHHRHHGSQAKEAKKIIESGVLGELVAVRGAAMFRKPVEYFDCESWRVLPPSGGVLMINLIHEIGLLRSFFGEIESVSSFVSSHNRGLSVEDSAAVSLRFTSGLLGSYLISDATPSSKSWEQSSGENKAFWFDENSSCFEIFGTQGSLSLPDFNLTSAANPREESSWQTPLAVANLRPKIDDPIYNQLDHLLNVVLGRASSLVTSYDGMMNLKVVEAIKSSAIEGVSVKI